MSVIVVQKVSSAEMVGEVILWYGLAVDVPTGWEVYAAANDCFVMGAASGELNTTPMGANTHSHTRAANTDSIPNHTHTVNISTTASDSSIVVSTGLTVSLCLVNHTHSGSGTSSAAGSHTHTIGGTNLSSHLPPYHRLYWIRKVS